MPYIEKNKREELFDRDLYILYKIKDSDGSFDLELRIDNAFCVKE
jgi:hypothetical protein